jgi:hypothetical protein
LTVEDPSAFWWWPPWGGDEDPVSSTHHCGVEHITLVNCSLANEIGWQMGPPQRANGIGWQMGRPQSDMGFSSVPGPLILSEPSSAVLPYTTLRTYSIYFFLRHQLVYF